MVIHDKGARIAGSGRIVADPDIIPYEPSSVRVAGHPTGTGGHWQDKPRF